MVLLSVFLVMAVANAATLPGQSAVASEPSRIVLLILDDLHIPFRSTPRMRNITERLITRLKRPGDLWAIVTTGTSSVSQKLTADETVIRAAVRRVIGNRLRADELLARRGPAVAEVRQRAGVAYDTAVAAIENLARLGDRPIVVFYFSGGYDRETVPGADAGDFGGVARPGHYSLVSRPGARRSDASAPTRSERNGVVHLRTDHDGEPPDAGNPDRRRADGLQ